MKKKMPISLSPIDMINFSKEGEKHHVLILDRKGNFKLEIKKKTAFSA